MKIRVGNNYTALSQLAEIMIVGLQRFDKRPVIEFRNSDVIYMREALALSLRQLWKHYRYWQAQDPEKYDRIWLVNLRQDYRKINGLRRRMIALETMKGKP